MKKFGFLFLGLIFLLSLIPITYAQRGDLDGDGLIGRADACPNRFGPRSNAGCPIEPTNDSNENDSDGDGNPNNADRCPNEGGPASNGGCPEGQTSACPEGFTGANCDQPATTATEAPQEPLPTLPEDGRCVLATIGRSRVNVRDVPDLAGEIVGQLDPFGVYPVHFHVYGDNPEDEWFLVDLGWVSATVVRISGNCRHIPTVRLPEPLVLHIGDLALVFVGDEGFDPANVDFPTDQIPTDQIPPFLIQQCEDNLSLSFLVQDFNFCDGSVMPTDQMPSDTNGSAVECDGDLNFFDVFLGETEVSLEGILIGLLLPAVKFGDGSVMPINEFLGDGTIIPCVNPDASNVENARYNLLLGITDGTSNAQGVGSGGTSAGKVSYQDLHFMAVMDRTGNFGVIMMIVPQGQQGIIVQGGLDPFAPFALNWGVPPDPETDWTQIGNLIVGHFGGDTFICPAEIAQAGDGSVVPSSAFEEVGFDPQPDPPGECLMLNFTNEQ